MCACAYMYWNEFYSHIKNNPFGAGEIAQEYQECILVLQRIQVQALEPTLGNSKLPELQLPGVLHTLLN